MSGFCSINVRTKAYKMLMSSLKRVDIICADGILDGRILHLYKECAGLVGLFDDTIFEEDTHIEIDVRDMDITTEGMEDTLEYLKSEDFDRCYIDELYFSVGSFIISLTFFDKFCMEIPRTSLIKCFKDKYASCNKHTIFVCTLVIMNKWNFFHEEIYEFIMNKIVMSKANIDFYKRHIIKYGIKNHVPTLCDILLEIHSRIPFRFYDYIVIQDMSIRSISNKVEKAIEPFDKVVYIRGKELSFVKNISSTDVVDLYETMNHLKYTNNETAIIKSTRTDSPKAILTEIKETFDSENIEVFYTLGGLFCIYVTL